MSAVEALRVARENGVHLGVAGTDLILDADWEPSVDVLDAIRRYKAEIVALLAASKDGWSADDWRVFFDERAGIAEHDAGLLRSQAETQAFECCLAEWTNHNPPAANGPDSCAHCGGAMADTEALPFLRGGGGHVWMHGRCHAGWMVQRRRQAGKALRQLGISLTGPA